MKYKLLILMWAICAVIVIIKMGLWDNKKRNKLDHLLIDIAWDSFVSLNTAKNIFSVIVIIISPLIVSKMILRIFVPKKPSP